MRVVITAIVFALIFVVILVAVTGDPTKGGPSGW